MHPVIGGILRLDRKECPGADVQGQGLAADPARVEGVEQARREVKRCGRSGDRALLARRTWSDSRRGQARRRRAERRCRAAAASCRRVRAVTRPVRPRGNAGALSRPLACRTPMPRLLSPKSIRSPSRARFALRRNARHSRGPSRLCSVAPMLASPRLPSSCAGMTLVSLNTRTSPGRSSDGRSLNRWSASVPPATLQQPRAVARARRPQGDSVGRKVEVEKIDAH